MTEETTTILERLGGTLGVGPVIYQGGRDELNAKCRARDDEIDRLRTLLEDLVRAVEPFADFSQALDANDPDDPDERAFEIISGATAQITFGDLRRVREAYLKATSETS
ncbi:hypothetical protein [Hyphomicrobium sp. MC1]|uniref:hypothetical protein n=1 Tax=Hyphomicrobium sp. (strain MC1) TaxID=717785 RepID=UPI00030A9B50|nr:hypothetical protein [Hyphomicrobium sp. MC1]